MPKTGSERARAYEAKTDPEIFYKRTKWGRQIWIDNYIFYMSDPADIDFHVLFKKIIYGLKPVEVGLFKELILKLFRLTESATDEEIVALHDEWIARGMKETLWQNALNFCKYLWELPRLRYFWDRMFQLQVVFEGWFSDYKFFDQFTVVSGVGLTQATSDQIIQTVSGEVE